jgi:nucleoside-diphosphate-sugar epimerase
LQQIILLSSTSVYAGLEGVVDEATPVQSDSIVAQGEALFQKLFPQGSIVRLGGLMGADRIAGQRSAKVLQDSAVNYVHRDDAVGIIEAVIEQNIQGEIINAVAPKHPKRSVVYKMNAEAFGFELPLFEEGSERIVAGEKGRVLLGCGYRFDDPMRFWSDTRDRCR